MSQAGAEELCSRPLHTVLFLAPVTELFGRTFLQLPAEIATPRAF